MGKTRRKYIKEFKFSIIRELESGVAGSEQSRKQARRSKPGWIGRYRADIVIP